MNSKDPYLSVSQITSYIGRKFTQDPYLEHVNLKGEITNFRERPNGHQYFSLKDDGAKIQATLFRNVYQSINFDLKDGNMIACTGRVNLYAPSGSYSIIIESLEPYGLGTLLVELQARKEKLQKLGLFSAERKRPIAKFPKKIAVITSPSGAVIRDIMTTARRRFPLVKIILFPAVVQGDKAAQSVLRQLKRADQIGDFDTIIIARGGGSFEDLWLFNDEELTIAVAESKIPVISSIGHETDTTLVDYAADLRAPTPTAAAELATPRLDELKNLLRQMNIGLLNSEYNYLSNLQNQVAGLVNSYIFKHPTNLYENYAITLDRLEDRLKQSIKLVINNKSVQYEHDSAILKTLNPKQSMFHFDQQLKKDQLQLIKAIDQYLKKLSVEQKNLLRNLIVLDPANILKRGYAIVQDQDGKVIDRVEKATLNKPMLTFFQNGKVTSVVKEIEEESNAK